MRYDELIKNNIYSSSKIKEEFLSGFKEPFRKKYVEIYKNPTTKELNIIKTNDGDVRAFLIGNDIIVWHTYDALHQTVREELKIPNDAIPLNLWIDGRDALAVVTDNAKDPIHHSPNLLEKITNHPYFTTRRIKVDVSYYDEAIFGPWHEMADKSSIDESYDNSLKPGNLYSDPDNPKIQGVGYWYHPITKEYAVFGWSETNPYHHLDYVIEHPEKFGLSKNANFKHIGTDEAIFIGMISGWARIHIFRGLREITNSDIMINSKKDMKAVVRWVMTHHPDVKNISVWIGNYEKLDLSDVIDLEKFINDSGVDSFSDTKSITLSGDQLHM
ncbi:MAG: hypothetical protein WC284_03780 [Candidimonas sp.]